MKKLFVIHNINNIKQEERQNIFVCNHREQPEKKTQTLKLSENQLNISNNNSTTTTNSSVESRKYSLNILSSEPSSSFNINTPSNSNLTNSDNNKFLGKKIKFHFDIIKSNLETIGSNLGKSQEIEINKETVKKNIIDSSFLNKKKKLIKKEEDEDKLLLNEGRWTFDEHIKFIKALIKYGKNWKEVQKYVNTRSSAQTRSHAQKFLLKLKMIKTSKFNFDFSNIRIKNLSDVIEEIKRKKDNNNEDENKYLLDTLISLSETISNENNISENKKIKKNKLFKKILKPNIHNNKKQNHKQNNDKHNNDKQNNDESNNEIINNISKILNNIEKQIEIKQIKKENKENKLEKKVNNINIEKISINKENTNKENEDFLIKRENLKLFNDDYWINNDFIFNSNKRLIFDNGFAFYFDNNYNYNFYNNTSIQFKEYYFNRNYEHPLIINKYFFS